MNANDRRPPGGLARSRLTTEDLGESPIAHERNATIEMLETEPSDPLEFDIEESSPIESEAASRPLPRSTSAARRGAELFRRAIGDLRIGEIGLALANVKLALVFDPSRDEYVTLLERLSKHVDDMGRTSPRARAMALFELAVNAERSGLFDRAIEYLNAAIELAQNGIFYNRLGSILATHKNRPGAALHMLLRAVELEPKNPAFRANLRRLEEELRGEGAE
jgi:tetratricopeptide (TPR) repeat protein